MASQYTQTTTTAFGAGQLHQDLAQAIAADPNNRGILYSRALELGSSRYNAFEAFTSAVDGKSQIGAGVRSIFAKKTDLAAGGGSQVVFNVIGPPGGPGAVGSQSLVDRTSGIQLSTYSATVAFHRDAVSFSKDVFEFLSAGLVLESTAIDLLSKKMGIMKQNHMMMRLITAAKAAGTNVYRPNNRTSTATITAADTIGLDVALAARARLSMIGGKPLMQRIGPNGSPVKGYLIFGTDMAFLPLRNDTAFMNVLSNGKANDAVVTGELFDWQGMPWYEYPSVDEKWDDYIGSPLLPKCKVGVQMDRTAPTLIVNSANTLSQYLQFFPGAPFNFDGTPTTAENAEHYAWGINPDGSYVFFAYQDGFTTANRVTVTKILSGGTTGIHAKTVGGVCCGTVADESGVYIPAGTGNNLPTSGGEVYDSVLDVGAVVIPCNRLGVPIGYSFVFGAMAACFANGRIEKAIIEQEEDFGFIKKRGFETIFGTCVTTDPYGAPAGYLLIEHAVEHEGYKVPVIKSVPDA